MSTSNTDEETCEDEFEGFENSITEMYCSMNLNTDLKNEEELDVAEGGANQSTEDTEQDDVLPSEERDKKYIYYPLTWDKDAEEKSQGGKWLIYARGDLDKLDYAWTALRRLYHDGTIIKIKSSTATDALEGVTMCYTADYRDKDVVKKAADEIRKLVDYDYIMYYKSNQASAEGKYRKYGASAISVYMHTVKGGFYEKDKHSRWTCLNVEESPNI